MFKGLLEFYTGHAGNLSALDKDTLKAEKDKILNKTVNGKTVESWLSADLKNLDTLNIGDTLTPYTIDFLDPNDAPGIKVQLLSVGEDIARAKVDRLNLDLSWIKSLKVSWEDQNKALKNQGHNLKNARVAITNLTLKETSSAKTIGQSVTAFRNANNNDALEISARAMLHYLLAATYDESLIRELETKPAVLEHEHAIRLAQINSQEREAFTLRGLESLNRYHQGGITTEEIANMIRAAQAAGIAVIGAQVGQ